MAMIVTENLCKSFHSLEVLKDVSLTIDQGEVVCIVGPSGAGKSTYLRALNNLETINSGKIYIDGVLIEDREKGSHTNKVKISRSERLSILLELGMVFQRFNLFPHMTALENIVIAQTTVRKRSKEEATEKALDLLERVGLLDKTNEYPSKLSGGQQQRLAIARALQWTRK
jgi:polar amino acid transport system ATP-binding protein